MYSSLAQPIQLTPFINPLSVTSCLFKCVICSRMSQKGLFFSLNNMFSHSMMNWIDWWKVRQRNVCLTVWFTCTWIKRMLTHYVIRISVSIVWNGVKCIIIRTRGVYLSWIAIHYRCIVLWGSVWHLIFQSHHWHKAKHLVHYTAWRKSLMRLRANKNTFYWVNTFVRSFIHFLIFFAIANYEFFTF